MNPAPKTGTAVLWSDLRTSADLTSFITDQYEQDGKTYATKGWIATTLAILKDEGPEFVAMTKELAQVAKLMRDKNISFIIF